MREPVKEKKKRCPLCQKEYPEKDNYCRTDGQRLKVTDAGPGTRLPLGPDDGYAASGEADLKALHQCTELMKTAWCGDTDAVTALLNDGVDVNSKAAGGITALMFAA